MDEQDTMENIETEEENYSKTDEMMQDIAGEVVDTAAEEAIESEDCSEDESNEEACENTLNM